MTKKQSVERQEAIDSLRETLKPGMTVYTILRHVSRSGMQREISLKLIGGDGALDLDWRAARAIGLRIGKHNGIIVGGCGMDMGFHLVYSLSATLFRGGFGCIGKGCPSNDHSNGDRDYTPHVDDCPQSSDEAGTDIPRKRAHRHYHSDGGYALRHKWL